MDRAVWLNQVTGQVNRQALAPSLTLPRCDGGEDGWIDPRRGQNIDPVVSFQ